MTGIGINLIVVVLAVATVGAGLWIAEGESLGRAIAFSVAVTLPIPILSALLIWNRWPTKPARAQKRRSQGSQQWQLPIAVLILLFAALLWRSRGFDELQTDPLSLEKLPRIAGPAIVCLIVFTTPLRRLVRFYLSGPMVLCGITAVLMLASAAWSSAPLFTLFKASEFAAGYLGAGLLALSSNFYETKRRMESLAVSYMVLHLLAAWFGAVVAGQEALLPTSSPVVPFQLRGVYPVVNPNSLGIMAALVALYDVAVSRKIGLIVTGRFGLALLSMLVAQSRTSWIVLTISSCCIAIVQRRKRLLALMIVLGVLVVASASAQWLIHDYLRRGSTDANIESLSGRTLMWKAAMKTFSESPLVGSGYASAARIDVLDSAMQLSDVSSLHNAWVDLLVGVGVLGTLPIAMAIIWSLVLLYRSSAIVNSKNDNNIYWFAMLLAILISTITSAAFAYHGHISIMAILCCAVAWRSAHESSRRTSQVRVPVGAHCVSEHSMPSSRHAIEPIATR